MPSELMHIYHHLAMEIRTGRSGCATSGNTDMTGLIKSRNLIFPASDHNEHVERLQDTLYRMGLAAVVVLVGGGGGARRGGVGRRGVRGEKRRVGGGEGF